MKRIRHLFSLILSIVIAFSCTACKYTLGTNNNEKDNYTINEQGKEEYFDDLKTELVNESLSANTYEQFSDCMTQAVLYSHSISEEEAYTMAIGCIENDLITATGCETKFGYVYVTDDTIIPGLIFTNWELANTEETTIYNAGFIQLKEQGGSDLEITEDMVKQGLIACAEGLEDVSFLVNQYTLLDSFSFVYSGKYVKYFQKSPYVVEIGVNEDKRSNYDEMIQSLYDYNNKEYVWEDLEYKSISANSYFSNEAKAYELARKTVTDIISLQDKNGKQMEVATIIIYVDENINQYLIDSQIGIVNGYSIDELDKIEKTLDNNQFLVVSPDGVTICTVPTVQELADQRVANGWIKAITGALILVGSAIVTVATCGAGAPALITAVAVVSGTVAIGYGACEVIEGVQDLYYGYNGDIESESVNFGVELFKAFGLSEEEARKTYHAVGLSSTIINQLTMPVGKVISMTTGFFRTTLAVGRVLLVEAAKVAVTGLASLVVNEVATDVAIELGMNPAYARLVGYGSALLSGMLVYTGLNKLDQKLNVSGLYPKNPLERIVYTEKVETQMNRTDSNGAPLDNHCFPREVDNYGAYGKKTYIVGNDGNRYVRLRISGNYKGNDGYFEYIYNPYDYTCNHRFFVISK